MFIKLAFQSRQLGWVFVGAIFLEPFILMAMRAFRGRQVIIYKTQTAAGGINFRWDFPVCEILALIGLLMLVRASGREAGRCVDATGSNRVDIFGPRPEARQNHLW